MIKFNKNFDKREFFSELGIIVLLFISAIVLVYCLGKADEYHKSAEVLCYYEDTAVEFITDDGNKWVVNVDSTEEMNVGDKYELTFVGKDTDTIYDDEVIDFQKR
jgi:hypothetical protein